MSKDNGVMVRMDKATRARLHNLRARYNLTYSVQGHLKPWWTDPDGPSMGELIGRLIDLDIARLNRGRKKCPRPRKGWRWSKDDVVDIVR